MRTLERNAALFIMLTVMACGTAPDPPPEALRHAERLNEFGFNAVERGRYRDAIRHFREVERHFLSLDDPAGMTRAAISQAEVHLLLNDGEAAAEAIERATASARRMDEPAELEGRILLLAARLAYANGRHDRARGLLQQIAGDETLGAHRELLSCQIAMSLGERGCADSLSVGEEDSMMEARVERLRAEAALQDDDAQRVERHLARALEIYRENHFRPGIAAVYELRGDMLVRRDERKAAREQFERALYLRAWIQDERGFLQTLNRLGRLAETQEERERLLGWRETVMNEPNASDWQTLLDALFTQR